jgi:hypothetical protein
MLGVVMAGERQVGAASPTLAHAFAASVAGLTGAAVASVVAAVVARLRARLVRLGAAVAGGAAVAVLIVSRLMAS